MRAQYCHIGNQMIEVALIDGVMTIKGHGSLSDVTVDIPYQEALEAARTYVEQHGGELPKLYRAGWMAEENRYADKGIYSSDPGLQVWQDKKKSGETN
ncbi:hypothetical protein FCL40_06815 [Ferrimonas sediminicola]|uniref:Uncharacterized protein n=1 Tax=Ferrimonas sediminicola TaxID=2569538 RepID=A0A4U1BFZ1_9GAMM|nr:hypothetical protein [Ferrimonas sediminicola]TKB49860.1 hypothetical protein FCL40_06815 [Ferrimonas sediminicola]